MVSADNYDFLLSMIVFLTAYASFLYTSPYLVQPYRESPDVYLEEARFAEHMLLDSPGDPFNWTSVTAANEIGLAMFQNQTLPGLVDPAKALAINQSNCTVIAQKIGLPDNGVKVRVSWSGNVTECVPDQVIGTPRYVKRPVSVGGVPGSVEVWVW